MREMNDEQKNIFKDYTNTKFLNLRQEWYNVLTTFLNLNPLMPDDEARQMAFEMFVLYKLSNLP